MRSRISSKGQVTVPAEVRARLGLTPGTPVVFVLRDSEVVMRKGPEGAGAVDRVYGTLRLAEPVDRLLESMRGPGPARARRKRRVGRRR